MEQEAPALVSADPGTDVTTDVAVFLSLFNLPPGAAVGGPETFALDILSEMRTAAQLKTQHSSLIKNAGGIVNLTTSLNSRCVH